MFCRYCGAEETDMNAVYCQKCGKKFDGIPSGIADAHAYKTPSPSGPSKASDEGGPVLFAVSTTKFCVMSIATFGLYDIYWFYKNWQWIKSAYGENISPFWRTFFIFFYVYSLFNRIREIAKTNNVNATYSSGLLTVGYIVLSLLWRLPDPFWMLSIFAFLFQLPVVNVIQKANWSDDINSRFTGWNIAGIVFGVVWWALIVFSMILPGQV